MVWLLSLILVSGFTDVSSCYVQGYVYASAQEPPSFQRVDACAGVRGDVQEGTLMLYSPQYWVYVPLPTSGGMQKFWYRWGAPAAHIESQDVPVLFGRITHGLNG